MDGVKDAGAELREGGEEQGKEARLADKPIVIEAKTDGRIGKLALKNIAIKKSKVLTTLAVMPVNGIDNCRIKSITADGMKPEKLRNMEADFLLEPNRVYRIKGTILYSKYEKKGVAEIDDTLELTLGGKFVED